MKTLRILLGLLLIATVSNAQYRNIQLQAAGLTCSMCSNAINKALKPLPFISKIDTDLKNNLFLVTVQEGATPDFDLLRKKVEDAGFSVGKLTVEANFDNLQVANDMHSTVGGKNLHFVHVKDQTLNGWVRVQIVDKYYIVASQYKKVKDYTSMSCYKTGVAGSCCKDLKQGERIYHVTI